MESFWMNSPPEPNILMTCEVKFDVKREPEFDIIMKNQTEPKNMAGSKLETENHVRSELETDVLIKMEPNTNDKVKMEPKADDWVKNEPEADSIDIKMELETDLQTELELGRGTKVDKFLVRIMVVYIARYASYKNLVS